MEEPGNKELLPLLSKPHDVSEKAENSRSDEETEIDDDTQHSKRLRAKEKKRTQTMEEPENIESPAQKFTFAKNFTLVTEQPILDRDEDTQRSQSFRSPGKDSHSLLADDSDKSEEREKEKKRTQTMEEPENKEVSTLSYVSHRTSQDEDYSITDEETEIDDDMQQLKFLRLREVRSMSRRDDDTQSSESDWSSGNDSKSFGVYFGNSSEESSDEYNSDEDGPIFTPADKSTQPCRMEIMRGWNLSCPKLLISVIGGREHLQLDQFKEALGRGLVKAARDTDAWIISDGLKTGATEYIGKAISDYKNTMAGKKKLVTIGIVPYECVQNKESLDIGEIRSDAFYDANDDGNPRTYLLDLNYSYFFVVRNNTPETFGEASKFKKRLIRDITNTSIPDVKIPAVTIMIGGGLRTLNSVRDSIKRKIPVVIVKDSGLAAVVMEDAYKTISENENAQDINKTDGQIQKKLQDINERLTNEEKLNDDEIKEMAKFMLKLKDRINLVSFYNNSGEDFDVAVLRAALKENELVRNMKLALKWNRIDILKNRGVRPEEADLQETAKKWFKENIKLRMTKDEEPTIPCDAFGEIKFWESSEKTAKFVRVDAETPMEIIIHMLAVVWNLPLPKLLISLLSRQEELVFESRDQQNLLVDEIRGGSTERLHKTAKDTGAWIIHPGLYTEEFQHIYRSDLNYEGVIIGIAPWNSVRNNESLLNMEGSWPAVYDKQAYFDIETYALDPRHSHFIFVDNGTPDTFGVETQFLNKLKETITKIRIPGTRIKIPVVEVLDRGGLEILLTWDRFVDIPVVIIKGSGGAADFLAKAYQRVSENEDEKWKKKKLQNILRNSFQEVKNMKPNEIKKMIDNLYTSIMKSNLVTFDGFNSPEKLHVTILMAVIKATKTVTKKMRLSLEWNRTDILKGEKFLWQKNVKQWIYKNIKIRSSSDKKASTPSDAFGEIVIQGCTRKKAKFVRVDHETSMETMMCLTRFLWKLPLPNLLISVMGDKTYLEFNSSIQEDLGRGLVEVARTTGAWIISEGLHTGAAKYVGKATYNGNIVTGSNDLVTIGIAPWNCVQNKKSLINEEGAWPALYNTRDDYNEETCFLDPNHSHFILVDNGTSDTFGTETKFKNMFKKTITEMNVPGIRTKVPAIAVMIGGGLETLHASISSLSHDIPVVIVKGSGVAADVMADAYQALSENEDAKDTNKTDGLIKEKLQDNITEKFKKEGENLKVDEINLLVESMLKLENRINFVSVYKDLTEDFDVAILRAVIKAKKISELYPCANKREAKDIVYDILKLTLKWNRIDIAKREIVMEEIQQIAGYWEQCICFALEEDRVDFLKLFKEYGANFKGAMHSVRPRELSDGKTHGKCIVDFNWQDFLQEFISENLYSTKKSATEGFYYVIRFYLWAFLREKYEIAFLIWTYNTNALPSALILNKFLKSLKPKCKDYRKRIQLQEQADRYEKYADGILTECLKENQRKTVDLLLLQRHDWNNASCMQIAFNVNNETFMSHNACQPVLNKLWIGKMSEENNIWKLLLCTLCPFFIFLIKFDEEKEQTYLQIYRKETKNSSRRLNSGENMFSRCAQFCKTPKIKFLSNLIFNIIFLGIYSYVLLVELQQKLSILEWLLIVWVIGIFTEEINQLLTRSSMLTTCPLSLWSKCINYIKNVWNIIDVFTIMLFIIGHILRLLNLDEIARVILCLNLISFYVRLLHMLSLHKNLGLKVVMIKKMMQDVAYFAIILLIFLTAFGIATQSILNPTTAVSFPEVFKKAYFHMYAELFLEEYEGNLSCNANNSTCPTEISAYTVSVLMCIYVLLTNIILLNLLIAMFSSTYEEVQKASQLHWSFQRYDIICEFCIRPPLPPPFILLSHIYQFCRYLCTKAGCLEHKRKNPFSKELKEDYEDLIEWEYQMAQFYVAKQNESDSNNKNLVDQLTLIQESQRQLKESQQQLKIALYENSQKIAECKSTLKESYVNTEAKK